MQQLEAIKIPRTVFDEPEDIDWLKAAVLERKLAKKLDWPDVAAKAKIPPDKLRKTVTNKHSDDWDRDLRTALCRALGISTKMVIQAKGVELR